MTRHIFYSWQADTPTGTGRNFLRGVLEKVCKQLSTDATLDEAERNVQVDSDTQGVPGQPPIAETIFKKIDDAAVVVADMTFTGKRLDGRPTPNPNVLIEYGWALKSHGYLQVLTVMNTFYGKPNSEDLPFDLAHLRWPMEYHLPADAEPAVKVEEKRRFTEEMNRAIRASLAVVPAATAPIPPPFEEAPAKDGPARFRTPGEALGFDEDMGGTSAEVFLKPGPAMWLRLMPIVDPRKRWPTRELLRIGQQNSHLMTLRQKAGSYSYVRASDGHGMYFMPANNTSRQRISTDAVTFAFRTGEVWSVDVGFLALDATRLYYSDIERTFVDATERFRGFLQSLGLNGPYRWIAGLVGVKGRNLGYSPPPGRVWAAYAGPVCAADYVEETGTIAPEQTALEALLPFFKRLFEDCGIERPDYLGTN